MLKPMGNFFLHFYAHKCCLSKPMIIITVYEKAYRIKYVGHRCVSRSVKITHAFKKFVNFNNLLNFQNMSDFLNARRCEMQVL